MLNIEALLSETVEKGGSDLHFLAGDPPRMRHLGRLQNLRPEELMPDWALDEITRLMTPEARQTFDRVDQVDFAYTIEGVSRFRVNAFRQINGVGAVFRAIPSSAFSLQELGLPDVIPSLCQQNQGMILVTGKTGSGKSTTLAAMVDHINTHRKGHIITIEDPIEFVHQRKRCLLSQREIGAHTPTFAEALRSALREDPNVILIGELRDLETMSLAVTAAETGILILGTLHTNSAVSTVDRVVNTFPANKQPQVRAMLATSLRAVISQQLVRTSDGKGRVAALEIMINTPAVANILREGKTEQLENALSTGQLQGMQTMDRSLRKLLDANRITGQDAYEHAFRKSDFERYRPARSTT